MKRDNLLQRSSPEIYCAYSHAGDDQGIEFSPSSGHSRRVPSHRSKLPFASNGSRAVRRPSTGCQRSPCSRVASRPSTGHVGRPSLLRSELGLVLPIVGGRHQAAPVGSYQSAQDCFRDQHTSRSTANSSQFSFRSTSSTLGEFSVSGRCRSWQVDRVAQTRPQTSLLASGVALRPGSSMFHAVDSRPISPFAYGYTSSKNLQGISMDFLKDWALAKSLPLVQTQTETAESPANVARAGSPLECASMLPGCAPGPAQAVALRRASTATLQEEELASQCLQDVFAPILSVEPPPPSDAERRQSSGDVQQVRAGDREARQGDAQTNVRQKCSSSGHLKLPGRATAQPLALDSPMDSSDRQASKFSYYPSKSPRPSGTHNPSKSPRPSGALTDGLILDAVAKQKLSNAFRRMVKGKGELEYTMSNVIHVFITGGMPYQPEQDWLREIIAATLNSRDTMDVDDFHTILEGYEARLTALFLAVYAEAAEQGPVLVSHLPDMLRQVKVIAMPMAINEVVASMKKSKFAARVNPDTEVNVDTFIKVYWELYTRAGLNPTEHFRLNSTFKKVGNAQGGSEYCVEPSSLLRAYQWHPFILGIVGGEERILQITWKAMELRAAQQMSLDPADWSSAPERGQGASPPPISKSVPENVVLLSARMVHEDVAKRLQVKLKAAGANADDVKPSEVCQLLYDLGAVSLPMEDVVTECMNRCGMKGKTNLRFEDVYCIFLNYCDVQGFSSQEAAALQNLYVLLTEKLADTGNSRKGALCSAEINRALRWLAYIPTQYRLYDFIEQNEELSELTHLSCAQFLKVIGGYRLANIGSVWHHFHAKENKSRLVNVGQLGEILGHTGQTISGDHLSKLVGSAHNVKQDQQGMIDWREFLRLESEYRVLLTETLKNNQGFTDQEVTLLKQDFDKTDKQNTGALQPDQVTQILRAKFYSVNLDTSFRNLLLDSQISDAGRVNFQQYLWVMRRVTDKVNTELLTMAKNTRVELGFTREEVREFRELFNITDVDKSGDVDFRELQTILSQLVNMGFEAVNELRALMAQVDANRDNVLDFWEFLKLMRILQDRNWRNINGVASGAR